jgi:23S rRNA (cytosine1962-C5)-methyltransferase
MSYFDLLIRSFEKRIPLVTASNNCFRLFNTDGDGLEGLAVDYYDGYYLIQLFEDSLIDDDNVVKSVISASQRAGFKTSGFLIKDRTRVKNNENPDQKYKSRLFEGGFPETSFSVLHDGIRVKVDLVESQNTGIFMDMRNVRKKMEAFYHTDQILLNLFSYTCVFGIHSVKNGVMRSVNVDIAKPVLKRGMENYVLNGLRCDDRDFIRGDSLEWIKKFSKKGGHFNFVIFDPPTFARSKKASFSVNRDYADYLKLIDTLVADGYVLSAANTFNLTREEYISFHPEAWENIFIEHESDDFPFSSSPYLKAGLWKVKK